MFLLYITIFFVIIWLLWWRFASANQPTYRKMVGTDSEVRKNYEQEVNDYIKSMKCEFCNSNEVPFYKLKDDGSSIINCWQIQIASAPLRASRMTS